MASNPKIVEQMRERQKMVFRIAMDPNRYGMSLKAIQMDSGLGYDSLRNYASGDTIMPITAVDALIDVIPDELLSLLLPSGRLIVRIPEAIDHDEIEEAARDFLAAKGRAHHPESPAGRDLAPCEDETLRGRATVLRAVL